MFYLDDTRIEQPDGWNSLYWQRVRNPVYFGIWRHATAMPLKGVGNVGFDGMGRKILRALYDKHGPDARCIFKAMQGGQVGYQSEVDFGAYNDDGKFFMAPFRDEDGVELDALADLVVGLTPQIQIELPQQPLSEGIAYEIDPGKRGAFVTATPYSLPLKAAQNGEGSALSVTNPFALEPIYRNSTNRTTQLKIEGKLIETVYGIGNYTVKAQVTADGTLRDEITLATVAPSGSSQATIISQAISLPPGAYLRIVGIPSTVMTVQHSGDSFVTLYENSQNAQSYVWGLTFKQAYEQLLAVLTGGKVRLQSGYLTKGDGKSRTLTSEPNLRGYKRAIQVSFKMLWEDDDSKDNLACWRRGDVLYIETKADMIKAVGRSYVGGSYSKLVHGVNPFYASQIQGGYDLWSSGTAAGREEFCSLRGYQTQQTRIKASVDLTCRNISASGRLMEVLRRNPQGQNADSGYEERLFVIVADRVGATYKARTGGVSGVTSPATVINADISPRHNMQRWMNVYGINGTVRMSSGQANTSSQVRGVAENKPIEPGPQLFTKRTVMIETAMKMQEYRGLGEVIEYIDHDGVARSFLVQEDMYQFGSGTAMLKGIELDQ